MSTSGDIMSTSGDIMMHVGVHRGIPICMWGSKLLKAFQFLLKTPMY